MTDGDIRLEAARTLTSQLRSIADRKQAADITPQEAIDCALVAVRSARKQILGQRQRVRSYATTLDRLEKICGNGWIREAADHSVRDDMFGLLLRGKERRARR